MYCLGSHYIAQLLQSKRNFKYTLGFFSIRFVILKQQINYHLVIIKKHKISKREFMASIKQKESGTTSADLIF